MSHNSWSGNKLLVCKGQFVSVQSKVEVAATTRHDFEDSRG